MSLRFDNKSLGRELPKTNKELDGGYVLSRTKVSIPRPSSQQRIQDGTQSAKQVSEPRTLGEQAKRSKNISSLQKEFEELKQKIKEVESKNEKIIEKIQTNQNFQRHSLEEGDDYPPSDPSIDLMRESIEPFRTHNLPPHPSSQKKKMKNSSEAFKVVNDSPRISDLFKRKSFRDSVQQEREAEELEGFERHSMGDKVSSAASYKNRGGGLALEFEARETSQKADLLEDKLKKSEYRLECVRSNFKNYSECVKLIVQNQLDRFMDSVVGKCLSDIDRRSRRNRERIDKVSAMFNKYTSIGRQNNFLSDLSEVASRKNAPSEDHSLEKGRHKELEGLVAKYEQLIKAKNDESEGVLAKLKAKEKELADMKLTVDKLKDSKRKVENEAEERLAKLEGKISQLTDQNRKLTLDLEKNTRLLRVGSTFTNEVLNKPVPEYSIVEELEKSNQQLAEAAAKVGALEKSLAEKGRLVTSLERELLSHKTKKQELITEYQQSLDRNRSAFKAKLEEHAKAYDELKGQLSKKEELIAELERREKLAQQRDSETRVEVGSLQQRLDLKEQLEKMREGQYSSLLKQYEDREKHESRNTPQNEALARQVEELQQELRQLKIEADRLAAAKESAALKARQAEELSRQLEEEVRELRNKVATLNAEMRMQMSTIRRSREEGEEDNLLQMTEKDQLEMELRSLQEEKARQIDALEQRSSQLRQENIAVHSRVIELENEVRLATDLKDQQIAKSKDLKCKQEQFEQTIARQQAELEALANSTVLLKEKHKEELMNLDAELKLVEDEFNSTYRLLEAETAKVNLKSAEIKKLQEELLAARKAWTELELLRADNEQLKTENGKSQLKLTDMEDELRDREVAKTRVEEELRATAEQTKQGVEKLTAEKVTFQEENRFLRAKIEELEMQLFTENQSNDGDAESVSEVRAEGLLLKVRALEKASVEQEIIRANLERYLRAADEKYAALHKEYREQTEELEKNRSNFHKIMLSYDEKIQEQEILIKQLEKMRDENPPPRMEQTKRSELKSQSSLMFSANSQIFDREIDFALSEVSDCAEPNVENIFEKDYPFEKLRLRRKDQVHLLEKTAEYIAKLKQTINDKNRKIRALEKRIGSLRANEVIPLKSLEEGDTDDFDEGLSDFNDNYSVKVPAD